MTAVLGECAIRMAPYEGIWEGVSFSCGWARCLPNSPPRESKLMSKRKRYKRKEHPSLSVEEGMMIADRMYEEDRGVMDAIPVFEDVPSFMRSELDEASELDMGGGDDVEKL